MTGQVGLAAAFGAGIVSFLSPCVLPLVPGYLSFLGGLAFGDTPSRHTRAGDVLLPALLFVLGFSAVFVALGVSASLLGGVLTANRLLISRVSGVIIMAFGFFMLGLVKVPWLYGEARFDPARTRVLGRWAAPVMGMAFGFAWTPCVGPILGSILMLAAGSGHAGEGALLLAAYSAGLGIPFLLAAALLGKAAGVLKWLNRHALVIARVSGVVLMALGALIATDTLGVVTVFLTRWVPFAAGG
ncbi:MAG TPA: cytochrome c biogenesis protein CcdA [Coriobacteriia bacterium]